MIYKYNWLFDVQSVGQFFKRLGWFLFCIVVFFIYFGTVNEINARLISRLVSKEYILLSTSTFNSILLMLMPAVIIILMIAYFALSYFFNGLVRPIVTYSDISRGGYEKAKNSKGYNITFFVLITGSILLYIFSINNFYAIFDNRIEKHTLITWKEHNYSYEDIKEVAIYVKDRNKYGGTLYYKIVFKDKFQINIANNISGSNYNDLPEINDIIKSKGIKRNIDRAHFHDLTENLGEQYIRQYEKLFQ